MMDQSILLWLASVVTPLKFQELAVFAIAGGSGMLSHYVKKVINKEIVPGLYNYLIGDHMKNTVAALSSFGTAMLAYVFSGTTDTTSWPAFIGLAFTTGYSLDSIINKGTHPSELAVIVSE